MQSRLEVIYIKIYIKTVADPNNDISDQFTHLWLEL